MMMFCDARVNDVTGTFVSCTLSCINL